MIPEQLAVQAMANGRTVMASAEVLAPPERVFAALVTEEVERWWGSADSYRMAGWTADRRVGGSWAVTVRTADGRHLPTGGTFLEIEAPRRIVQTRRFDWDIRRSAVTKRRSPIFWNRPPAAPGSPSAMAVSRDSAKPRPSMPRAGRGCSAGCRDILARRAASPPDACRPKLRSGFGKSTEPARRDAP